MPCQGLFYERNKTNFFNGIWSIPNTDFEREGSFFQHLFEIIRLLIDVMKCTSDSSNLIELCKALYQKPDADK